MQLPINRDLLDANFDGYKVSMQNVIFKSKSLEQKGAELKRSPEMVTLQHMKVLSNDNQLFCDDQGALYRILNTGHIQQLVYEKFAKSWTTNIVGKIKLGSGFPSNLVFTDRQLVVCSNGSEELWVFLRIPGKWVKMMSHRVEGSLGISLIEARVLADGNLHILFYEVEKEEKKTVSKIQWITVGLADIDVVENLTVLDTRVFYQNGHFETCTLDNEGNLIFLSSEKPQMEGAEKEKKITHTWNQSGKTITVTFDLNEEISEQDVDIDMSKSTIRLKIKNVKVLEGHLFGEIDENDVEICADRKENKLKLVLKATADGKWTELVTKRKEDQKSEKSPTMFSAEEASEECDEADASLAFYWLQKETGKVLKSCDVSGCQVLFVRRDKQNEPAEFCLRHDVDGIIWSFAGEVPSHVATLQAFGYVQASKTTRFWSGGSPSNKYACIVEANNRIMLYSQKVEVDGNLCNRKTAKKVSHVSKQHLLRVESSDPIRGVVLTDTHLFAVTSDQIHVVELDSI